MTGARLVVDGLWRCLCPSFDAAALVRAVGTAAPAALRRNRRSGARTEGLRLSHRPRQQCTASAGSSDHRSSFVHQQLGSTARQVHNGAGARVGRLSLLSGNSSSDGTPPRPGTVLLNEANASIHSGGEEGRQRASFPRANGSADSERHIHALLAARPPYQRELESAPTASIYAALRQLQDTRRAHDRVQAFVRHLLDARGEPPTAMLVEALVRANCDPRTGAADAVRDALQGLRDARIEATPSLYHGALAVLAVHPDYLLRNLVLQAMRERWIDLAPAGQQSVALGLLRDGQYERALDQLEAMAGAVPVPGWLYDIFVYVLGQEGFLDDALKIVNHRLLQDESDNEIGADGDGAGAGAISLNIWSFLLDACARQGHYPGLVYVWRRVVRGGGDGAVVTPSDATALDVLNAAARRGDAALAAEVLQMLAARGTKLGLPHFEAMLDCYAAADAMPRALQALCIMHDAAVTPDAGSTRSLYQCLTRSAPNKQVAIDEAVAALFDLKTKYGGVPLAAFNVVLEAILDDAVPGEDTGGAEANQPTEAAAAAELAALDLYRHVRQLCPAGPGRATFRLLFGRCTDPRHLNFLAAEMRSFGLRPDADAVDRLVYVHATRGSLDVALRHVYDLMGGEPEAAAKQPSADAGAGADADTVADTAADADAAAGPRHTTGPWISRRTAAALAQRCADEEDGRIWAVADASRARGRPMDAILRDVFERRPSDGDGSQDNRRPQRQQMQKKTSAHSNAYGVPHAIDVGEDVEEPAPEATLSG